MNNYSWERKVVIVYEFCEAQGAVVIGDGDGAGADVISPLNDFRAERPKKPLARWTPNGRSCGRRRALAADGLESGPDGIDDYFPLAHSVTSRLILRQGKGETGRIEKRHLLFSTLTLSSSRSLAPVPSYIASSRSADKSQMAFSYPISADAVSPLSSAWAD